MAPLPPAPPSATDNLFTRDFIQSVANGLDEFVDVGLFRGDGDLNFERDFGQWFNPDDVGIDLGKQ
jgi:collagen type III alpha